MRERELLLQLDDSDLLSQAARAQAQIKAAQADRVGSQPRAVRAKKFLRWMRELLKLAAR